MEPWITFRCMFINRSSDVAVDHTDGGSGSGDAEKDWEMKNCCCFAWRRHRRQP